MEQNIQKRCYSILQMIDALQELDVVVALYNISICCVESLDNHKIQCYTVAVIDVCAFPIGIIEMTYLLR